MITDPEVLGGLISTVAFVGAAAYGYIQNLRLKEAIGVSTKFANLWVTATKIREDGSITTEESEEFTRGGMEFFTALEDITGKPILNSKETGWFRPKI